MRLQSLEAVRALLRTAVTRLGYPDTILNRVHLAWDRRAYALGTTILHFLVHADGGYELVTAEISFSECWWPLLSGPQRRQVVVHEACHLVDGVRRGHGPERHDEIWWTLMQSVEDLYADEGTAEAEVDAPEAVR